MGKRLLKLPRRLFGYQPSSVDQLIKDRDSMLGMAEQRVRSAEARIAELEEELSRREEDLEAVRSQLEPDGVAPPPSPSAAEPQPEPGEASLESPPEPPLWTPATSSPIAPLTAVPAEDELGDEVGEEDGM